MDLVIGMGEYIVSDNKEDTIRTFALGSCVAVTVYCQLRRASGMIHVVLPSPLSEKDILERPGYFAVTGVPLLIETLCQKYGCKKNQLNIEIYGGANLNLSQDVYIVGEKNIDAVKAALYNMGLRIVREDLSGNESRTLTMDVKTGEVQVTRQPL